MIAVAAKGAPANEVAFFVRDRFGEAPVVVYRDTTGSIMKSFNVISHPDFRFVTAQGTLTTRRPAGFPRS